MSPIENKKVILDCIELFNKGTLEWVDKYYSKKLEWTELSNPSVPQGRRGDYFAFRKAAEQSLSFFPDRTLTVIRSIAENNIVVLEQNWIGTLAFSGGTHLAGEIAKLKIASFFTLKNGLIINQVDYCATNT